MVRRLTAVIVLALVWFVLSDVYTVGSVVAGLIVALLTLWGLALPIVPMQSVRFGSVGSFLRWLAKSVHLFVFFLWKMWLSNVRVARVVLSGRHPRPGIIRMPVAQLTPRQLTVLSLLIGLTPGTMVVATAPDHRTLYIHALEAEDEDGTLYAARSFERMVQEVIPW